MITLVDSAMRKVSRNVDNFTYKLYEPIYSSYRRRCVIIEVYYFEEKYVVEVDNYYLSGDCIDDWCQSLVGKFTRRGYLINR